MCIIECNYILMDTDPWQLPAMAFELRIFVDVEHGILRKRLLDRHMAGGRSRDAAPGHIDHVDLPNARQIRIQTTRFEINYTGAC